MLILKHMQNDTRLMHLQCTFPKLTETNQFYVLGLAEGLKQAQGAARISTTNNGDVKSKWQTNRLDLRLAKTERSGV